jgi:hypothetical protein
MSGCAFQRTPNSNAKASPVTKDWNANTCFLMQPVLQHALMLISQNCIQRLTKCICQDFSFLYWLLLRAFRGFLSKIQAAIFLKASLDTLRECVISLMEILPLLLLLLLLFSLYHFFSFYIKRAKIITAQTCIILSSVTITISISQSINIFYKSFIQNHYLLILYYYYYYCYLHCAVTVIGLVAVDSAHK